MSEPIRVLIVDDHAVVRTGLRKVLEGEDGIEVVGEAGDARNAVFQTRETKPDVILMDVVMPGKTGIEAIPDVLHDAPEAKVLILSMQDDPRYVREAFDAGASGYVLKEAVDTDVVAAIRDVAAGGRYVHPALGARMLAADAEERKRAEQDPLSDRERDVLRLLALGHTNQEIAGQLYISVRTAETHRAHIMQKLRISTRAELVRYALTPGIAGSGELLGRDRASAGDDQTRTPARSAPVAGRLDRLGREAQHAPAARRRSSWSSTSRPRRARRVPRRPSGRRGRARGAGEQRPDPTSAGAGSRPPRRRPG